jgi:hypothetical protein
VGRAVERVAAGNCMLMICMSYTYHVPWSSYNVFTTPTCRRNSAIVVLVALKRSHRASFFFVIGYDMHTNSRTCLSQTPSVFEKNIADNRLPFVWAVWYQSSDIMVIIHKLTRQLYFLLTIMIQIHRNVSLPYKSQTDNTNINFGRKSISARRV